VCAEEGVAVCRSRKDKGKEKVWEPIKPKNFILHWPYCMAPLSHPVLHLLSGPTDHNILSIYLSKILGDFSGLQTTSKMDYV